MCDVPESVARRDSEAQRTGEVEEEALPELADNGCNGHAKSDDVECSEWGVQRGEDDAR